MTSPAKRSNKIGAEISLSSESGCNLCDIDLSKITSQEELNEAVKAATFIGTLQAGYTDFFYLRDSWRKTMERDALLGISLTGVASCPVFDELNLKEAAQIGVEENKRVSSITGINPAKRITTTKPSGSTSLVLKTSSGVHGWHAPYYIRRQRFNKSEPIFQYLQSVMPALIVDDFEDPANTGIFELPIAAPPEAIFTNESAIDLLKRVRRLNTEWIDSGHLEGVNKHNVSCTISTKPDEWDTVREWMWDNRRTYGGIALYPYIDLDSDDDSSATIHTQLPFEEISKETYESLSSHLVEIDLTQVKEDTDETNLVGELACSGGNCTLA